MSQHRPFGMTVDDSVINRSTLRDDSVVMPRFIDPTLTITKESFLSTSAKSEQKKNTVSEKEESSSVSSGWNWKLIVACVMCLFLFGLLGWVIYTYVYKKDTPSQPYCDETPAERGVKIDVSELEKYIIDDDSSDVPDDDFVCGIDVRDDNTVDADNTITDNTVDADMPVLEDVLELTVNTLESTPEDPMSEHSIDMTYTEDDNANPSEDDNANPSEDPLLQDVDSSTDSNLDIFRKYVQA